MTNEERLAIIIRLNTVTKPENIPTLDELPQADVSDLVQAYQYQRTIDEEFESW